MDTDAAFAEAEDRGVAEGREVGELRGGALAIEADCVFGEFARGFSAGRGEAGELEQFADVENGGEIDRGGDDQAGFGEGDGDDGQVFGDAALLELLRPAFGGAVGFGGAVKIGGDGVGEVFLACMGWRVRGSRFGPAWPGDLAPAEVSEEGPEATT